MKNNFFFCNGLVHLQEICAKSDDCLRHQAHKKHEESGEVGKPPYLSAYCCNQAESLVGAAPYYEAYPTQAYFDFIQASEAENYNENVAACTYGYKE